jgi:hypothetical protein
MEKWSEKLACRELRSGDVSFSQLLLWHAARTEKHGKDFVATDRWGEAAKPAELGLKGSVECKPDGQSKDILLDGTGFPTYFRGKSTFAEAKLIRFISRCGVPGLWAHDLENSHLNLIWMHLPEGVKVGLPCLAKYIAEPLLH